MKKAPLILSLDSIKECLKDTDLFGPIKRGFIDYSEGKAVIPPVGEMIFDNPPGEAHIKYGFLKSFPYYVIKIASGFYNNPKIGLSSSQGVNLLFDKNTGVLICLLLDEGHLTDIRTAVAGALASSSLANSASSSIGIVGSGIQAELQLKWHLKKFDLKHVNIWNHNIERAQQLAKKLKDLEVQIEVTSSLEELCSKSDIIVTTTPSKKPLILSQWIQPGTHITAVGSDTSEKIELDSSILDDASCIAVDSIDQSQTRGEVFQARNRGLRADKVLELGTVLNDPSMGRRLSSDITVADLTGVAVQDLMISLTIFEKATRSTHQ